MTISVIIFNRDIVYFGVERRNFFAILSEVSEIAITFLLGIAAAEMLQALTCKTKSIIL